MNQTTKPSYWDKPKPELPNPQILLACIEARKARQDRAIEARLARQG